MSDSPMSYPQLSDSQNCSNGNSVTWEFAHLGIVNVRIGHLGIAHLGTAHMRIHLDEINDLSVLIETINQNQNLSENTPIFGIQLQFMNTHLYVQFLIINVLCNVGAVTENDIKDYFRKHAADKILKSETDHNKPQSTKAKNVILFIGDGMGSTTEEND
uniref:Alkaline phosphatase n=1 Tax=Romanomermis culicivorax TaxID=13658 RepID=A0A915JUV7_ROMCU